MDHKVESSTAGAPSLISLCHRVIGVAILRRSFGLEEICQLPSHLVDSLLKSLDPLGLESLQPRVVDEFRACECGASRSINGVKRKRFVDLSIYWKALFFSRWPTYVVKNNDCRVCMGSKCVTNWQYLYWEMHLQSCLDEASERASLPGFNGYLGEILISDSIVDLIINEKGTAMDNGILSADCLRLAYHCQKFGHYARHLRLRNVLCVAEMWDLLGSSNLQHVVFCNIRAGVHVDGACNLLVRYHSSLLSIEFLRCKFPLSAMGKICQYFGKSLFSLKFCETQLGSGHAKSIFDTLLHLPSPLSIFEISDSDIKHWQYNANLRYKSISESSPGSTASLGSFSSIRALNLRGNELDVNDAQGLRYSLSNMKNLSCLNLSDNPLTDDGIRILIPCFIESMGKTSPLTELKIDNCHISSVGAIELLTCILKSELSLKSLSIACNELGSSTAAPLARFLKHSNCQILNIEDICLDSLGFDDFQSEVSADIQLLDLNISKNRGGVGAARCISKVIFHAPELVTIAASHNLLPPQSVEIVCRALEYSKGHLRKLDLTGNWLLHQANQVSKLASFFCQGKPIVILPPKEFHVTPYDDDP